MVARAGDKTERTNAHEKHESPEDFGAEITEPKKGKRNDERRPHRPNGQPGEASFVGKPPAMPGMDWRWHGPLRPMMTNGIRKTNEENSSSKKSREPQGSVRSFVVSHLIIFRAWILVCPLQAVMLKPPVKGAPAQA